MSDIDSAPLVCTVRHGWPLRSWSASYALPRAIEQPLARLHPGGGLLFALVSLDPLHLNGLLIRPAVLGCVAQVQPELPGA